MRNSAPFSPRGNKMCLHFGNRDFGGKIPPLSSCVDLRESYPFSEPHCWRLSCWGCSQLKALLRVPWALCQRSGCWNHTPKPCSFLEISATSSLLNQPHLHDSTLFNGIISSQIVFSTEFPSEQGTRAHPDQRKQNHSGGAQ